ncbi:Na(+):H(+) antiporter [Parvularcula bermudensis HTCC2503]|uniref:Na(+):H(+) antiporter n=1 Tax=Parvularcula bermudensis (strain ATCC BAA-594 / HTCC2503 / KCTC 12087) TaxID=314260 RepID=E0TEI8_PARBH|nr:sodium:proton antiporter [Parvularcula bermudensis]ADM10460.1 Na(+):H(+) antiporter [Parvularcula bermudensis HTCC2503]
MGEYIVLAVTLIGILGIGAQWLAWRTNMPAIVLMSIAGLIIGPLFGILRPEEQFGDFYRPIISIAVAVILFEGGLQLKFSELRGLGRGVGQIVFIGGPLAWLFGAIAGHYVAGLDWPTAILFAGIMIVTGPTVIIPLLRQAKLSTRPSALLKWEGIINDPIGALAAVITYEFVITQYGESLPAFQVFGSLFVGTILCVVWGVLIGLGLAEVFRRGWAPEYLKAPILLSAVLLAFEMANLLQEEGGLLAVTAMGVAMANSKMPSINQIRHFKETIAVLLVAGVFVLLTANLTPQILGQIDLKIMFFVGVMLFVVRPAAIFLATIGTELKWSERALVAWIAPRGIVAVAVSGLFAASMGPDSGFEEGGLMVPLAFAMVFATVVLHGFTIAPLGKLLGLASDAPPGVLIVGASPWSIELAKKIHDLDVPVLVTDPNYRALRGARNAGIPTYYGEILSEVSEHHIEFVRYGHLLALSGNEAHNSLVCTDLAPELSHNSTYQLSAGGKDDSRTSVSFALQGRSFLSDKMGLEDLLQRHWAGWKFQFTRLSEAFPPESYLEQLDDEAIIVMVQRRQGLTFQTAESPIRLQPGDRVLSYVPPEKESRKANAPVDAEGKSEEVRQIEQRKEEVIDDVTP